MIPLQPKSCPPSPFVKDNMELVMVSTDQVKVVPPVVLGVSISGGSSNVPIVRMVVNPNHSSPTKEVAKSLKRKNS